MADAADVVQIDRSGSWLNALLPSAARSPRTQEVLRFVVALTTALFGFGLSAGPGANPLSAYADMSGSPGMVPTAGPRSSW